MKSFIKATLLILLSSYGMAQKKFDFSVQQKIQLDSLKYLLHHVTNDSLRMDIYKGLGFYYAEINRDSSLFYGEQQLALAKKLKQPYWETNALSHIGYVRYKMENYPNALKVFLVALKLAENPESEKNIWGLLKGENPRIARLNLLSGVLFNMALLYGATGNTEKQVSIFYKNLKYADTTGNTTSFNIVNMNLGLVYMRQNKLDSALNYEQKALYYSNKYGYIKYKGGILYAIGSIYFKEKNYLYAKKYFLESIKAGQEQRNILASGDAYIALSDLFRATEKNDSSLISAKKGLENFKILHSTNGILKAYSSLSSTYKLKNNIDSAFHYLQLAMTLSDSLNKSEKEKLSQVLNIGFNDQLQLEELEKERIQNQNRIRIYAMLAGLGVFLIIALILYRGNQQKHRANVLLSEQKEQIQKTLDALKATQVQLIQKEKMASLGELTAGIAHEIQNPLNFVNNFSDVSAELVDELEEEHQKPEPDSELETELLGDLKQNLQKITHHGKRASSIVKGMLEHSRTSSGEKQPTNLNTLADEYLRLAYQGLRAKDKAFNCELVTDFAPDLGLVEVVPQDIGRVLLNLYNNAFYAVREQQKVVSDAYQPTVNVVTKRVGKQVEISVGDNGTGISDVVKAKIFQPFFTTKPTGEGTGLGLSLSYDIVTKGHNGTLAMESQTGVGTKFILMLPL